MKLLGEILKVDNIVVPQALAPGAQGVSRPHPVGRERKALFVLSLVATTLIDGDILDFGIVDDSIVAPAASGALAALVAAGSPAVMAFQNVTASVQASVLSIETAAAADGAITINGVVFTWAGAGVPGTGVWNTAAELAIEINTLLPNLLAADVGTVVTIRSLVAGEQTITVTETVTAIIPADILTLEAVAYLEVDMTALTPGAANLVAVIDNVAGNTGTATVSVALLRGNARYAPVPQAVA
ncbi:MAG TPA: hypothetical protein VMW24_11025 [Sedimentisphaerales bacterium]|nr:hypothetical protein [Sedimentisphaerales bacterium]